MAKQTLKCDRCDGHGYVLYKGNRIICPRCQGIGIIEVWTQDKKEKDNG